MSLRLNNSKDITCDKLWLLDANNNLQDVLTLISNAGGSGVVQSAILPLSITNAVLSIDLANYAQTSQLALKQDVLTAGTGITISGSTISSTGGTGATQAWVLANCLSPLLNPGTLGVGQGLQSTFGQNAWAIQVDEVTDVRSQFILINSNNQTKLLQHSITGALMWGTSAIPDLTYITNQLSTKANTFSPGVGLTMTSNVLNSYSIELGAVWQSGVDTLNFTGSGATVVGNK